jgi:hypothetical protein
VRRFVIPAASSLQMPPLRPRASNLALTYLNDNGSRLRSSLLQMDREDLALLGSLIAMVGVALILFFWAFL